MPELRVENLGFSYPGGLPILRDVTITLRVGDLAVIVARNASGKTTLLKLLAGILTPTEGKVVVSGTGNSQAACATGLVFQNPDHQMIAPTVEAELALGLEFRNVAPAQIEIRLEELFAQFGLQTFRYSPPESLSGGQKQRVALAAVFAMEPPFLLLDEPDSFLDAPGRRALLDTVDSLRDRCGILWTVPDSRLMPPANRWFTLHEGRLTEVDKHTANLFFDSDTL